MSTSEASPTVSPASPTTDVPPQRGDWEFVGWGTATKIRDLEHGPIHVRKLSSGQEGKLGQLRATAICGNDISSSCLYVSALSALAAGRLAPVALAIVAVILYLFRRIYAEVGSALPLNGGAYNVLLNTTSKAKASVAACLTLLSYVATAVISASEAMHYAHNLWSGLDVVWATVALLGLFAALNLLGITESAVVAVAIFAFHLVTLTILSLTSGLRVVADTSVLQANWAIPPEGGMAGALFFGFAAAMLGISGFESSANFIEEQKPGVFPKTLRNMWIVVALFNPLISFLSLGLVPLADFAGHKEHLLSHMGELSAGNWLRFLVSLDAVLVLSGAVLTSYVGVTGLVRRMSLDRCLPQFLLRDNRSRGTNHWIILLFFALCCSILAITHGDVQVLGGVYTLSFLGVMALFAIGNGLLKVKRSRLPREVRATWLGVVIGFVAVAMGIIGNVLRDPHNVEVFTIYFTVTVLVVALMFLRTQLLRLILAISQALVEKVQYVGAAVSERVRKKIGEINAQPVIFFTRGDNDASLNRAVLYVRANEQTHRLIVVHAYEPGQEIPPTLGDALSHIDRLYPELRIDFVAVEGHFGPELIERLSARLSVPKNYMFIGCPGDRFPHSLAELGGVRLIL